MFFYTSLPSKMLGRNYSLSYRILNYITADISFMDFKLALKSCVFSPSLFDVLGLVNI